MRQIKLNLYRGKRGGRRPGSGRKRIKSPGCAHRQRETISRRTPLHINFKYRSSIRNKETLKLLKRAIRRARTQGLKILHYSFQSNHIHLIVEADKNAQLTKGMRSLTITFAKGLKRGRIQLERYHLHVLKSIRETANAIHYVLFNQQKHEKGIYSKIDGYSSVLLMERALELVQKLARKQRITLQIERAEYFPMDTGKSFLFKRGLEELFC